MGFPRLMLNYCIAHKFEYAKLTYKFYYTTKENKGVFIMERDLKLINFYTVALYMCNINI